MPLVKDENHIGAALVSSTWNPVGRQWILGTNNLAAAMILGSDAWEDSGQLHGWFEGQVIAE